MSRMYEITLAAGAALFLTLGAIVTVPPAQAAAPAVLALPALA